MPSEPPKSNDAAVLARLNNALESNGYSSSGVDDLIPSQDANAFRQGWPTPVLRRTTSRTPLNTLVRLFSLGLEARAEDLGAVAGAELEDWVAAGLVSVRRETVSPEATIRPVHLWGRTAYLACDVSKPGGDEPPFADFVRGITRPSRLLAKLTARETCQRALDLGTGEGVQAIVAGTHCEEVVATDVNPRALAFARFNLALNGAENVSLRQGDRYEPVAGERFNLIVSNPPYVISPAKTASFRDSGLEADTICATTIRDAAHYLAPGGRAYVLAQWALHKDERWQDRIGGWVLDSGCNALAVQQTIVDPEAHATAELFGLGMTQPKKADQQFDEWMRYYDDRGIVGIGTGYVVLRRVEQPAWFRAEELSEEPADDASVAITAYFENQDWLSRNSEPGSLMTARFGGATTTQVETNSQINGPRFMTSGYTLRQSSQLHRAMDVTRDVGEIVLRCDGSRTLQSLFEDQWQARGRGPSSPWHEQEFEAQFRRVVEAGFLVPMD